MCNRKKQYIYMYNRKKQEDSRVTGKQEHTYVTEKNKKIQG